MQTAVKARTLNNGQSCIAAKRFIVAEAIADEFTRRFVQGMEALRVGDPMDEKTDIGPLAMPKILDGWPRRWTQSVATGRASADRRHASGSARQLLHAHRADRHPAGLASLPGRTVRPSRPAVPRPRLLDDAIRLANDTPFGLGSSVWTNDPPSRTRLINEIEAGMTFINGMVASDPRLPFGGIKRSGYGRELSEHGLREFRQSEDGMDQRRQGALMITDPSAGSRLRRIGAAYSQGVTKQAITTKWQALPVRTKRCHRSWALNFPGHRCGRSAAKMTAPTL